MRESNGPAAAASPQANKQVKTLLYLAALSAVRYGPALKAY